MLTMSNAMIESYIMPSSKLHAVRYVEPGIQVAAIPTYPVSQAVNDAIREILIYCKKQKMHIKQELVQK